MKNELLQLGFSSNEADVYPALVYIGQTGAGEIVKRTGLHRNIVYETLDRLISRKLVFKVANNKIASFKLADPKRILVEQKTNLDLAEKILPEIVERTKIKQGIIIYDGLDGFRTSSLDYLKRMKSNSTLHVLGAIGDRWFELMGNKHAEYECIRLEKNITMKEIIYGNTNMELDKIMAKNKDKLYEIRTIEMGENAPANMLILDNTIVLQTLVNPYSSIQITNSALASAYLNHFQALWKKAKKV